MKQKVIKFYIAACVLVVVVFFGAVELATRTISRVSGRGLTLALHERDATDAAIAGAYLWHPFTGMIFRPNGQIFGGHPNQEKASVVRTDRYGFLTNDDSLKYPKAADELRIAFIGASTTACLNLNFYENWPGGLGRRLQKELPNKTITIINAAAPGYDTAQSIGNLALRVMPFQSDVIVIYHAYNDLKMVRKNIAFKPDYSHVHNRPYGYHPKPGFFKRMLSNSMAYVRIRNQYRDYRRKGRMLSEMQDANRLSSIPPEARLTFEEHIRSLVAIAQGGGAKVVLSSFATLLDPGLDYSQKDVFASLSRRQKAAVGWTLKYTPGLTLPAALQGIREYNHILFNIADTMKTGWVDNANLIPHNEQYFVDRVHFTAEGADRMAQNFYSVVISLLKADS